MLEEEPLEFALAAARAQVFLMSTALSKMLKDKGKRYIQFTMPDLQTGQGTALVERGGGTPSHWGIPGLASPIIRESGTHLCKQELIGRRRYAEKEFEVRERYLCGTQQQGQHGRAEPE